MRFLFNLNVDPNSDKLPMTPLLTPLLLQGRCDRVHMREGARKLRGAPGVQEKCGRAIGETFSTKPIPRLANTSTRTW